MTITEKLHEFDKKNFLEGKPNKDLVNLFEATKNKLTSKDIDGIKKIIDSNIDDEDKQTSLQAVLDKKLNEDTFDDEEENVEDEVEEIKDKNSILDDIVKQFEDKCEEYMIYLDYCSVIRDINIPFTKIGWSIERGDWKHDHLDSELIMEDILESNGLKPLKFNTKVTEDDGSDTYSADHCVIFDIRK